MFHTATFNIQKLLAVGRGFQNSSVRRLPDTIYQFRSNVESYKVTVVPFPAFEDSSRGGIETRAMRAEPHASC